MEATQNQAALQAQDESTLRCSGMWTRAGISGLMAQLAKTTWPDSAQLTIDATDLEQMDTAGAWLLHNTIEQIKAAGKSVQVQGLAPKPAGLLQMVADAQVGSAPPQPRPEGVLEVVGRSTLASSSGILSFLAFFGECISGLLVALVKPWTIRWNALLADIQNAGFHALPIIGLLSFLLGVVIAYQGAVLLRLYGADIYVVDLVGLAMVRELAPMMAAIIVAGRTGSAYTAQIGTMVVTEEVAALRTIGIPPMQLLVLPKLISLVIVLPLLTVFADLAGLLGGLIMVMGQLDLTFSVFLDRIAESVSIRSFMIGIGKAPVFAVIIAVVGCYQGFQVRGGAESVGYHTTASVVHSIFLVIVADAAFSVYFSWLGI